MGANGAGKSTFSRILSDSEKVDRGIRKTGHKVSISHFAQDHAEKLNLFESEQRWIEIVSSFRSGKKTAKTRKSLSAYDFIEGPVGRKRRNEVSDETVYDPKPSSYQMCLNSDDFADTFRKTLHSIIFFKIC